MESPAVREPKSKATLNQETLDRCSGHHFVEVLGVRPQRFECSRCGGVVDGTRNNYFLPTKAVEFTELKSPPAEAKRVSMAEIIKDARPQGK